MDSCPESFDRVYVQLAACTAVVVNVSGTGLECGKHPDCLTMIWIARVWSQMEITLKLVP